MKLNILMVDNERELLDVASVLLERQDVKVWTAQSFKEAEGILKRQSVHLIICDYELPCGNGVDWMRYLRLQGERALFLIYTGNFDVQDQRFPALEGTLKTVIKTDLMGLVDSIGAAKRFWDFENDGLSSTITQQDERRERPAKS